MTRRAPTRPPSQISAEMADLSQRIACLLTDLRTERKRMARLRIELGIAKRRLG